MVVSLHALPALAAGKFSHFVAVDEVGYNDIRKLRIVPALDATGNANKKHIIRSEVLEKIARTCRRYDVSPSGQLL